MHQIKNLLLIDDDNINNFIVINKLKKLSVVKNIISVENGEEAIEFISYCVQNNIENLPELILLDINMPIMDGWDFLDEFEKLDDSYKNKMHIYMVSSSVYQEDIDKSKKYSSVKKFISKPLNTEALNEIIQSRMKSF